jgi:undecaprenyl-diphosphatase
MPHADGFHRQIVHRYQKHRLVRWLGLHDYLVIGALAFIALGTYGFVKLLAEVRGENTVKFDELVMQWVGQHRGSQSLEEIGRDLTALGGVIVLSLITTFVVIFLAMRRMWHAMWLLLAATCGGAIVTTIIKDLVARPRPEIFEHRSYATSGSFPSGHSMLSAAVYLTLGSLLSRFTKDLKLRLYFLFVACLLTFLVGISRIYMGVHWPTDVLAGWSAGAVWASICWTIARILQVRGAVETEIPPPKHAEKAKEGE